MNKILINFFLPILSLWLICSCDKEKNTEPDKNTESKKAPVIKDFVLGGVLNNAAKFYFSLDSVGLPLRETGICRDTVMNPVIKGNNSVKAEPAYRSVYHYSCIVSGLTLKTRYYARAYAINDIDTAYSDKQISFQTDSRIDTLQFAAWVRYEGIDCFGAYVIYIYSFDENSKIKDGMYYADRLSPEFKIPGLKILLNCREPTPSESYPCHTLGPGFPHVIITGCKKVPENLF